MQKITSTLIGRKKITKTLNVSMGINVYVGVSDNKYSASKRRIAQKYTSALMIS